PAREDHRIDAVRDEALRGRAGVGQRVPLKMPRPEGRAQRGTLVRALPGEVQPPADVLVRPVREAAGGVARHGGSGGHAAYARVLDHAEGVGGSEGERRYGGDRDDKCDAVLHGSLSFHFAAARRRTSRARSFTANPAVPPAGSVIPNRSATSG